MRDDHEVHKRNSGIDLGRDAGLVSTRSSHASELKGLFQKAVGEEKSKAWQRQDDHRSWLCEEGESPGGSSR